MVYTIKYMFADAVTMELEFEEGITVLDAKAKLIQAWPSEFVESSILIRMVGTEKDPVSGPEDIRMIHSGKVLEDSRTFEDYKIPSRQKVIMHLQPKPALTKVEMVEPSPKPVETKCCTIL